MIFNLLSSFLSSLIEMYIAAYGYFLPLYPMMVDYLLAGIREELGITQLELATRINRDQRTVSSVESGSREPLLSTVVIYARGLGVRAAELAERYERELEKSEKKAEEMSDRGRG